jgi:tetratricopeptide (TPR) repeat protein
LYDLALNFERLDEPWESISYYNKYLELDPFAEHVWNSLGILYTSMEEYGKAEESFDFSIAIDPYFYSAYYDKADMLMKSENICKAIAVYHELLSVDALNTKALCEVGNCYQQIGDFSSALDVYWKALEIAPDCSDAWYGIGVVNFRQKRYLQSTGILKKAISLQPANADYWYILGESYYGAHRFNKAIEAYIRASELNPYDYNILTACAQALFRKHRIAEAKIMLTKLHQFNREDPLINYRLAACHAYLGELTKAQYYFKKGLSLNFHEHNEMFKLYPKTKTLPIFRRILDNYLLHMELFNKSRN